MTFPEERAVRRETNIVTTSTGTYDQGPLAPPGRACSMSTRVNDLATEVALPRERCGHLGLPTSEAGSEDQVRDSHIPPNLFSSDPTNYGDIPFFEGVVKLGAGGVERRLAPGVDLQNVDI